MGRRRTLSQASVLRKRGDGEKKKPELDQIKTRIEHIRSKRNLVDDGTLGRPSP